MSGVPTPQQKEAVLENLRELEPEELEKFVARLWQAKGWDTELTKGSHDEGIDFFARRNGSDPKTQLVQVKRRAENNPIGEPKVREYSNLYRTYPNADDVVIVTTGKFTRTGKIHAYEHDVEPIDGEELAKQAIQYREELSKLDEQMQDSVSEVAKTPTPVGVPALPSIREGVGWLFSPDNLDRWRNMVSVSAVAIAGSFLFLLVGPPFFRLSLVNNVGGTGMFAGWVFGIYAIHRDVKIAREAGLSVTKVWPLIALMFPFVIPFIYLKMRDPVTVAGR